MGITHSSDGGIEMKYTLNEIMTIAEAAEKYNINIQTLKNKFKPSIVGPGRINEWIASGLIRQSGKTWLMTEEFIKIAFK